ncbi:hypothetical protein TrLO_g13356 [Triparma laevis f. longispina]|uniref:Uncharacterized protein n=1 Tax=Triparma laevis f. longispina TaxID=1714387 RepID=A0A9W7FI02_9STRA|nr:hypothetical protein TrLO_g13356 [Triparma laevis f. longispina]
MLLAEQQRINQTLGDCERQEKKLAKKAEVAEGFYLQMKERALKEKYKIKELLANNTKDKALRDAAEARKVIEVAEKEIEKLGRDKLKLQNERLKRGATETETKTKTKMSSPQKSILRGSSNNQTKPNKKPIATVTKPIATKPIATKPTKPQAKPKKRGAKATPPPPTGKKREVNVINLKITPKKRGSSTMASTSEC